jgi:hypothetical protein
MTRYAAQTAVRSEKSRAEIETTLRRYGCHEFAYSTGRDKAAVGFLMNNLSIRFTLPMPDPNDNEFLFTPGKRRRRDALAQTQAWEQATRQRWRALALAIKAKLEAVECGITTFEEEFLAHVVTENGRTIGERMVPRLAEIAGGAPLLEDMRSRDA